MKRKITHWLIAGLILAALCLGFFPAVPAAAAATTSIHVVKLDVDGTTILDETTVDIATLESSFTVQGDGVTHYYTQGPTLDPDNLWDPDETCPGDSLKDKGALKGTALSDICSLVGGASSGDMIKVVASDNYYINLDYANVYNTLSADLNARQGKIVVAWYNNGYYSGGGWSDGMLLSFFPEASSARASDGKLIFGHQDMYDCLPENRWHWYWDNSIQYPSTHGLWNKYVNTVYIYSGGSESWTVELSGAQDYTLTQEYFEEGMACHNAYTFDNETGYVWSGLPLWLVTGLVDDDNVHGPGAYNSDLAETGYSITVTSTDGYYYTFTSQEVYANDDLILACKLNGENLSDNHYPLKLVSPDFSNGAPSVAQIASIALTNLPDEGDDPGTGDDDDPLPTEAEWPLQLRGALSEDMSKTSFQAGVSCHGAVSYVEDNNTWSGMPLWMLVARIDDDDPHGEDCFNDELAAEGYQVKVWASDGFAYTFESSVVARNDDIIVANQYNGEELPLTNPDNADKPWYPLKLAGGMTGTGWKVGAIVRIELLNLPEADVPVWDLNADGVCDVGDVVTLGLEWGAEGTAAWIPEDLNGDGVINIGDVVVLGQHWNETWE